VVLPDRMGMKRARVNRAATSISGKELREGHVKIIRDEGGDDVFFAVRDNKEVTCTNGVKVVLPARARVSRPTTGYGSRDATTMYLRWR